METPSTTTELIKDYHKRDTRGRRITEPKRKAQIISGYGASCLTQKAYARSEGVNYHILVSWFGQSQRASDPPARSTAAMPLHPHEGFRLQKILEYQQLGGPNGTLAHQITRWAKRSLASYRFFTVHAGAALKTQSAYAAD